MIMNNNDQLTTSNNNKLQQQQQQEVNGKPKQYYFINKVRCPFPKCNRLTSHILYFLTGMKLNIISLRSAFCEDHATKEQERYKTKHNRETIIKNINDINKEIEIKYGITQEQQLLNIINDPETNQIDKDYYNQILEELKE